MNHADHVRLLRAAVAPGGTWADPGSGTGAFTLALADLLGPAGVIHSVDRDSAALREQARELWTRFPQTTVHAQVADFTQPLDLPPLDGIVMANALHFVREKEPAVRRLREYLKPGGTFVLVEYDTDAGNHWVPYPLSFTTWETLAARCGFTSTRLLDSVPSRFLGSIYSAGSTAP